MILQKALIEERDYKEGKQPIKEYRLLDFNFEYIYKELKELHDFKKIVLNYDTVAEEYIVKLHLNKKKQN